MNRRITVSFLIAALLSVYITGCQSGKQSRISSENKDNSWLEEMTISQLKKGYAEGKYTIREVVSTYLERIDEIDRNGPGLNSVIVVNPDALQIAEALDKEMASGKIRGPLHGIPVILKDNIDTFDKMPTTAGSNALENSIAPADSWIAKKLRESGAVIIAKANLSEWANFRASVSSSGWSGIGGQTKNPYILDRNPCGSSSGSGVAVSANLCMVAIGTETNGSIVCPSNNNGIAGIKPTVGLISRSGIIPISFNQDTPGPMARTVEDAAICLGALTGVDTSDIKTLASANKYFTDYTEFLKPDGLKGKRIGIFMKAMGYSEKVDTLFNQAIKKMRSLGATIIKINDDMGKGYDDASFQVLLYEFKDGLNKYLSKLGAGSKIRTLKDLIEFNKKDSIELKYFNQEILVLAESKGDLNSPEYIRSLKKMQKATREDGIDKIMNSNSLDALVAPTGSPAWKTDLILGDHFSGSSSSPAAIAGYPSITVPMGFISGLPVGISFFGRAWSEPVLIEIAYSYEQATKHRKAPGFYVTD